LKFKFIFTFVIALVNHVCRSVLNVTQYLAEISL